MKVVNLIIPISKEERFYLEAIGCKFGNDLHKTYSGNNKYYATERPWVLKKLEQYRANPMKARRILRERQEKQKQK